MQPDQSSQALRAMQSSVRDFLARANGPRPSYRVVVRNGLLTARLPQDKAPLAAELLREFGDAVHVTVGFKVFPSGESSLGQHLSDSLHDVPRELPGIRLSFDPPEFTMPSGGSGGGEVIICNTGPGELAGTIGGNAGWLRRPQSTLIVGGYWGMRAGTSKRLPRNPGDCVSTWFSTGTASCEPGPHYSVPAGRYEVVVPLDLNISGEKRTLLAEGCTAIILKQENTD